MPQTTRIATCCYCGARAALILRGEVRHELSCAACGAPLQDLKRLPVRGPQPGGAKPHRTRPAGVPAPGRACKDKRKKVKRRKTLGRRFLDEAFDALEDLFD
ncbi:hypothetical protein [Puniceibacterium confluentis]|uniref:hypothetical protein n=1 Tax=Puniceibacterium confluentis TaxID=1958944 RepID=UPI003564408B